LKTIPKWIAGVHNGQVVRSRFVVPINFQLKEETKVKIDKKDKEEFPKLPAVLEFKGDKSETVSTNLVRIVGCKDCPPPLYIVDGVEGQSDVLKNIHPENIESISVLKDKKAVEPYGKKGENGVIIITSKKK
jgi:TonB-dependent SusC/RagA subfamily outer membrane receptor